MEELLEKAKAGDEAAYEEIVNLIYADLYNVAKAKLCNEEDANDAVQETLIKFYKNFKRLKNPKYMKTWIIRILLNECKDVYSSRKRKSNLIEKLQSNAEIKENDLDKVEDKSISSNLLKKLNEKEKIIVNLYYENDYTTSSISELLNMKENTVKSHLHRAKEKLSDDRTSKKQVSKITIMLIALIIISSSMTFAGRMIKTLKETICMFQITATNGVDDAISNGYVESINTDFSYNNGIGIKIDSVSMDDKLLYISYILDTDREISDVQLEKYSIYDNFNNVLSVELESNIKNVYGSDYSSEGVTYSTKPVKLEDGKWSYSTVFQVIYDKNYPLSKAISIDIGEISILSNNKREVITGNWKFTANLDNKFSERSSEYYKYNSNDKIKNISAKLNDMSMELIIEFNEDINEDVLSTNNIILQDENGEIVKCFSKVINVHKDRVTYICDIGKYSENIDTLSLYMKYNYGTDKYIDTVLEK